MNTLLLEPLTYDQEASARHKEAVTKRFDDLVAQSRVDVQKNRETVASYNCKTAEIDKIKSKIIRNKL